MTDIGDIDIYSGQGELRAYLAQEVGSNPDRYLDPSGDKCSTPLLAHEVSGVCEQLDIEAGSTKRSQIDALMEELGREHRTGIDILNSTDLLRVVEAVRGDDS